MFRVKIAGDKKGNISIGILIILSIVLLNLVIVITSVLNIYRGARVFEINAYKDAKGVIEESVKNDKLENEILSKINDFVKNNKKDGMTIEDTLRTFPYSALEKNTKYKIGYDSGYNHFYLDEDMQPRKKLAYFIKDGKIMLTLKK